MQINTTEDAIKCIKYYLNIEFIKEFHHILKIGCLKERIFCDDDIEYLQFDIRRYTITTWGIMTLLDILRKNPNISLDSIFNIYEIEILMLEAQNGKLQPPKTIEEVIFLLSRLAGYMPKSKRLPGYKSIWTGYSKFQSMANSTKIYTEIQKEKAALHD